MRRRSAWFLLTGAVAIGLGLTVWVTQKPSIRPNQVKLEAILIPPGQGVEPAESGRWLLEVGLQTDAAQPLYHEGRYDGALTPVAKGAESWLRDLMPNPASGEWQPWVKVPGRPADKRGFRPLVEQALAAEGLELDPRSRERHQPVAEGAMRARFTLSSATSLIPDKVAVVYTHTERRWGRELSWSRLAWATVREMPSELMAIQTLKVDPLAVRNGAPIPAWLPGELPYKAGHVLLWEEEPDWYHLTAVFQRHDYRWEPSNIHSMTKIAPITSAGPQVPPAFGDAISLTPLDQPGGLPLWALSGFAYDPAITAAQIRLPDGPSLRVEVKPNRTWLVAHTGPIAAERVEVVYLAADGSERFRETILTAKARGPKSN